MTYPELQHLVHEWYGPALVLRKWFPHDRRRVVSRGVHIALLILFVFVLFFFAIKSNAVLAALPFTRTLASLSSNVYGLFLILLPVAFALNILEAFHRSYYFRGLSYILDEHDSDGVTPVGWGVATIVLITADSDITGGFLESDFGQEILYRAGVDADAYAAFAAARKALLNAHTCVVPDAKTVTLGVYADMLYAGDESFRQFLSTHSITGEQLRIAADWVSNTERARRLKERWWSRDNLGRIPGLGKTWAYGQVHLLERYGHDFTEDHIWPTAMMSRRAEDDEVEEMEEILARARQSNVLLLGDDLMTARQRVAQLYHKIREGHVLPPLEGRRVFLLDLEAVVAASAESKSDFENKIRAVFKQAARAGNIMVYIEHLGAALASASVLGADLAEVILPYFESDSMQILASSDLETYHTRIERDGRLAQVFDVVTLRGTDAAGTRDLLLQRANAREQATGVVCTVPAIEAIATDAERYFPGGVMPDKAFDLLEELITHARSKHAGQIFRADVDEIVRKTTGVPVGEPSQAEREKLLSLEDFMHKRVVGQDRAVQAVARALRRARAGVADARKPMGSFLFLGPTGVGKTETAKALAEALFGSEKNMVRFDMSEFQGPDALTELLGSYETGKPGRLAVAIREHQYGVLLLDEFEKSMRDVHDLFLQVLDEGRFTDAAGKPVIASNLIIIATSNAGAELLWEWEKEGKEASTQKRALIDHLVSKGLYRPEFLNRFDDVVVFHPLTNEQVQTIARIQLNNLAQRLRKDKSITLTVTEDLVAALAAIGYDPKFGGRPMNRAIKDRVEQAVADKVLAGTLVPGGTLTLTADDIQEKSAMMS